VFGVVLIGVLKGIDGTAKLKSTLVKHLFLSAVVKKRELISVIVTYFFEANICKIGRLFYSLFVLG
jgi:hypothetical protein